MMKLVKRRLDQLWQVLTSRDLIHPEKIIETTVARYSSPQELKFYTDCADSGLDDFELEDLKAAQMKSDAKVLVVGCGTGRECFAFEKMGHLVFGMDLSSAMITEAKRIARRKKSKVKFSSSLPEGQTFDLVYISPAINGHIPGREARVAFYSALLAICNSDGILVSHPEIKKLVTTQTHFWASQILRARSFFSQRWQPGDTVRSFLGNHNADSKVLFYHYYPSVRDFHSEMKAAGYCPGDSPFVFKKSKTDLTVAEIGKYLPPVTGGMESALADLVAGLEKRNLNVKCLVANSSAEIESGSEITGTDANFKIASTPISLKYLREAKNIKADLLHIHLPNPLATFAFFRTSIPTVVTYHCDVLSYPHLFKLYKPFLLEQLEKTRAIIISSPHLIDSSPLLKIYKNKTHIIPFGIDKNIFRTNEKIAGDLGDIKSLFGRPLLLFVGRLVEYKGLSYLLEAMKSLDATLIVVGDGPLRGSLKAFVARENLEEKVHFFNNVPRPLLGSFYEAADVFVLPSIDEREAFGISLIEAAAFAKPLVTTNLSTGVNFVNLTGVTGLTAQPRNVPSLIETLSPLIHNADLRHRFGQAALHRYSQNFTLTQMLDSHASLFRCLVTNPGRTATPTGLSNQQTAVTTKYSFEI